VSRAKPSAHEGWGEGLLPQIPNRDARGNAWQDLKNNERAIADYDTAIKLDPTYATAYYNRGNSRLEAGDKDGAVADYRQAAKLNPSLKQATEMLHKVETKL
jgi:tetratricopeptide (TPR) repeat protein